MKGLDIFRRFADKVRIVHHVPGRIRFKLEAFELEAEDLATVERARLFQGVLDAIPGVYNIRLNLLARSCTVEYDSATIPEQAWSDLLAGKDSAAAQTLLAVVSAKFEAIAQA